jgi:RNA polymerase sigma-70 factor (ECF subfamily)
MFHADDRMDAAPATAGGRADAGTGLAADLRVDPDAMLMQRYAAGDLAAFEALYERHERPVYRFLLRSVGEAAIAEDLLQEVWMGVVRSARTYRSDPGRALFTTWLYRIARNRLIDHWRARDPAVLRSLDAVEPDEPLALAETLAADPSQEPEALAMDRARARDFVRAVEALPAAQREAFLLHAQAELSVAQIAEITGAGAETIKSRLRYAADRLRRAMQEWRKDGRP